MSSTVPTLLASLANIPSSLPDDSDFLSNDSCLATKACLRANLVGGGNFPPHVWDRPARTQGIQAPSGSLGSISHGFCLEFYFRITRYLYIVLVLPAALATVITAATGSLASRVNIHLLGGTVSVLMMQSFTSRRDKVRIPRPEREGHFPEKPKSLRFDFSYYQ